MKLHLGLTALAMALFAGSLLLGAAPLSVSDIAAGLVAPADRPEAIILREIRLPRALAAFLTGGALGIAGAGLQALFRNPLAEPGILGIGVSASFAAALMIAFGIAAFLPLAVPLAAAGGALLATAFIALAAARLRSVATLILVGVGLSSLLGALMSLVLSLTPNPFTLAEIVNWTFGSVANRSWADIRLGLPMIALGGAFLLFCRRSYAALTLGEETAETLGFAPGKLRLLTVLGAGLATGGSVAMAGAIGFVGIVAPHVVRPWCGHDPGRTLLPSFIMGGIILLGADIAIRLIPTPSELRLGIAAALIGAPVFVAIAAGRGRR
jgi:iron complex transport system permease protein